MQAKEKGDERNIEQQLTEHITKFLMELEAGLCLYGHDIDETTTPIEYDAIEFCRIVSGREVGHGLLATRILF